MSDFNFERDLEARFAAPSEFGDELVFAEQVLRRLDRAHFIRNLIQTLALLLPAGLVAWQSRGLIGQGLRAISAFDRHLASSWEQVLPATKLLAAPPTEAWYILGAGVVSLILLKNWIFEAT